MTPRIEVVSKQVEEATCELEALCSVRPILALLEELGFRYVKPQRGYNSYNFEVHIVRYVIYIRSGLECHVSVMDKWKDGAISGPGTRLFNRLCKDIADMLSSIRKAVLAVNSIVAKEDEARFTLAALMESSGWEVDREEWA